MVLRPSLDETKPGGGHTGNATIYSPMENRMTAREITVQSMSARVRGGVMEVFKVVIAQPCLERVVHYVHDKQCLNSRGHSIISAKKFIKNYLKKVSYAR